MAVMSPCDGKAYCYASGGDQPEEMFKKIAGQPETVNIPVRRRTGPLHLLVDSTGFRTCGEGEWKVKKHGARYRRAWCKVHLAIDTATLDVRAVEMPDHRQGDAAQAEELLSQLNPTGPLASVSDDGACDTRGFYRSAHTRGAVVIVPPLRNGSPWKDRADFAQARNATLAAARHLGWWLWKKWRGYHWRSLIETTMRCFKLLGERLAALQPERQVAEAHVRRAILNTFNQSAHPWRACACDGTDRHA